MLRRMPDGALDHLVAQRRFSPNSAIAALVSISDGGGTMRLS
jgi:hypothetical protein